ncbi:amino acid-binding protein, partial [Desulfovibrio sp. OttesenSCG-928-G11]|nr:amino acid-binding protein [Desulfovibrio sp. OttesenSCG-928-G11]
MSAEFIKLIHSTVLESPIPAKVLAKKIGKPYSTLLREINPYDQGAKLGVETFVEILKNTGDITAVEYIANQL